MLYMTDSGDEKFATSKARIAAELKSMTISTAHKMNAASD